MSKEAYARELVYDSIARLLPTLGRDFTVDIELTADGPEHVNTTVKFVPITDMGKAILPHMQKNLAITMQRIAAERGMVKHDGQEGTTPG